MAITSQSDLINARASRRQGLTFRRTSVANMVAGALCSMYRAPSTSGQMPQPVIPAAAAVPDKALSFNFAAATVGNVLYVDSLDANLTQAGRITWYDRVFHLGGLSGTSTAVQSVNSQSVVAFPVRGAPASALEWFLECYTDLGGTAVTATVAVTYDDSSTGNIAVAVPATWRAGRLLAITPAVAGRTIVSVQSVQLSATTGAAGNFGVTAGNRLSGLGMSVVAANVPPQPRTAILRAIEGAICMWAVIECSTTSSGDLSGELVLVEG